MKKLMSKSYMVFILAFVSSLLYSCKKGQNQEMTGMTTKRAVTAASLEELRAYKNSDHALMMGYFRTWRDKATDPIVNKTSFMDLPDSLDVALVFPDGTPSDNPFWNTLKNEYIPYLHERGTKVVMTSGVNRFLDQNYTNDQEGYDKLAKEIADYYQELGLDGLDIDVERSFTQDEQKRVIGVFTALSRYFGPKSNTGRLLIYDTNQNGNTAVFNAVNSFMDYVLVQSYGRSVEGLQSTFDSYASLISPKQYLIGFSFYEENGANWGDVTLPLEQSRAYKYAKWQPGQGVKGGVFSYAIDRDGSYFGDNAIVATEYKVTRDLISVMNPPQN